MEEIITSYLIPTLATIITGVASYVGLKIKSMYEKYIDTKTKREIVEATVKYVEQICKSQRVTNEDKLNLAKEKALNWLNDKGIKISETELEVLIESAVNSLVKIK